MEITKGDFLIAATEDNRLYVYKALKDKTFDPTVDHNYAIRSVAEYGYYKMFKMLIEDERIKQSCGINGLLNIAVSESNYDIVELLLREHGANVKDIEYSIFVNVVQRSDYNTLRILAEYDFIFKLLVRLPSHRVARQVIMNKLKLRSEKELIDFLNFI